MRDIKAMNPGECFRDEPLYFRGKPVINQEKFSKLCKDASSYLDKCSDDLVVVDSFFYGPDMVIELLKDHNKTMVGIINGFIELEDERNALDSMKDVRSCPFYDQMEETIKHDLKKVKKDGMFLKHVRFQTQELCIAAVKDNAYSLQFVEYQTPEICMEAVRKNGYALQFVKHQTPEICMAAMRQNGSALRFVKEQTPEICIAAVSEWGYALKYVKHQTPEICVAAVGKSSDSVVCINDEMKNFFSKMF